MISISLAAAGPAFQSVCGTPRGLKTKESKMAVLMTADVPGQTPEGYDGMLTVLSEPLRKAQGFIAHMAAPTVTVGA